MRTADNGGFLLPKRKPRIGSLEWVESGPSKPALFNSAYDIDGTRLEVDEDPWTVIDLDGEWHHFKTQPEALAWVLQEARK
jgi:hypothetical protein